jgi:hypothetical protein
MGEGAKVSELSDRTFARIGCVAAGAVTLYHSDTVTFNRPMCVVGDVSAPPVFQSGNQYAIGDGGTGTVEYLCSGGKMSRKAFNFGSCHDANNSPQTVHCTRPGLPFADIDSATS